MSYIRLDEANEDSRARMDPEAFLGNVAPHYVGRVWVPDERPRLDLFAIDSNSPVVRSGRAKPLPQILVV